MTLEIRIGEINLTIRPDAEEDLSVIPAYLPFRKSGEPDILLRLHREILELPAGNRAFDCRPVWTLTQQGGMNTLEMFPDIASLRRALVFKSPVKETDLYFMGDDSDPFYGPTIELLMVHFLAQGRGLTLHACGVVWEGKGLLFVGESRAGKSTMARLWAREKGVEVLSDDRMIVRKKENEFLMYGTPWHGEGEFASPGNAKVEKMFFISHGSENAVREIRGMDAAARLLTCSFPPYWDLEGMAFTLDLISELTAKVSCQALSFRPERGVVELLKG
jgi:hypothetical protein